MDEPSSNPSVIAAIASILAGAFSGAGALWLKSKLSRSDIASRIMQAQTEGWDTLVDQLRSEITAREDICEARMATLERKHDETRARLSNVEDKYRECQKLHKDCQLRVAALERLIKDST